MQEQATARRSVPDATSISAKIEQRLSFDVERHRDVLPGAVASAHSQQSHHMVSPP
jgi:hypothetical protein